MKLTKKNAARQRAIQKILSSGKALGGLLVGLSVAAVSGCREGNLPESTMGLYPAPQNPESATNEANNARPEPDGQQKPQPVKQNAVRERRGKRGLCGKWPASSE